VPCAPESPALSGVPDELRVLLLCLGNPLPSWCVGFLGLTSAQRASEGAAEAMISPRPGQTPDIDGAASDGRTTLAAELGVVVKHGGQLTQLAHLSNEIPELCRLAGGAQDPRTVDGQTVLALLGETFAVRRTDFESAEDDNDEVRGYRILFGLATDYRMANANARRVNAAEYLPRPRPDVPANGDSVRRRSQPRWLLRAADLLLERANKRPYEVVGRTLVAHLGPLDRVDHVKHRISLRAHRPTHSFLFTTRPSEPATMQALNIVPGQGVDEASVVPHGNRYFETTLRLSRTIMPGNTSAFEFESRPELNRSIARPNVDFYYASPRSGGQSEHITVVFGVRRPELVWRFDSDALEMPGSPSEDRLAVLDSNGAVTTETKTGVVGRSYGIAWMWLSDLR
jgi:hypothetical protein